jgi:hypothetical protein
VSETYAEQLVAILKRDGRDGSQAGMALWGLHLAVLYPEWAMAVVNTIDPMTVILDRALAGSIVREMPVGEEVPDAPE